MVVRAPAGNHATKLALKPHSDVVPAAAPPTDTAPERGQPEGRSRPPARDHSADPLAVSSSLLSRPAEPENVGVAEGTPVGRGRERPSTRTRRDSRRATNVRCGRAAQHSGGVRGGAPCAQRTAASGFVQQSSLPAGVVAGPFIAVALFDHSPAMAYAQRLRGG